MPEPDRRPPRDVLTDTTTVAARASVALAFTLLGAGVVVVRRVLSVASVLLASCAADSPTRDHQARTIRERAEAAQRAARASGLLSDHH